MFERFFYNDDGTLVDRTIEWSNPYTATAAYDCKSYLYVSSFLPFNHKYIDIATANDKAASLSIDIWYNSAWTSVADILDDTVSSGKPFAKSGIISFYPDKLKGWDLEDDSSDITELSTRKIYNSYWMRFGLDAESDSACVINHIGHKFCDDYALFSLYPMFNNSAILTQFETGKTNWSKQEIIASNCIVSDLKSRSIIVSKDQVIDAKTFELACIHKTAELIFAGMGSAFRDDKTVATKAYVDAMNMTIFNIDANRNGSQDRVEREITYYMMGR